jgi:hypothetical protein
VAFSHCYPPLISNEKLWLIFFLLFVRFFPSFISNTSIVSINFRANLDAHNAGNGIFGLGKYIPRPSIHARLATCVAFGHCYPPLIYYLTERSLFRKCPPPHGKILHKGPGRSGNVGKYSLIQRFQNEFAKHLRLPPSSADTIRTHEYTER